MADSFQLNNYTFTILAKNTVNDMYGRKHVNLQCTDQKNRTLSNFWIYASNSELGIWKLCLCINDNNDYYKHAGTYGDYVQTTLIHLDLQNFINNNRNPYIAIETSPCTKHTEKKYGDYKTIVDDDAARMIKEKPFIDLNDIILCGEKHANIEDSSTTATFMYNGKSIGNNPDAIMTEFCGILESLYNIVDIHNLYDYTNVFENLLNITGHIGYITLRRKTTIRNSETNNIRLYFYSINRICTVGNGRNENPGIQNSCSLTPCVMPILLTDTVAECNKLGIYKKYIPSGPFICKLYEYNIQCTEDEIRSGQCTPDYSLIGSRYKNKFPFTNIIAMEQQQPVRSIDAMNRDETVAPSSSDYLSKCIGDWCPWFVGTKKSKTSGGNKKTRKNKKNRKTRRIQKYKQYKQNKQIKKYHKK